MTVTTGTLELTVILVRFRPWRLRSESYRFRRWRITRVEVGPFRLYLARLCA